MDAHSVFKNVFMEIWSLMKMMIKKNVSINKLVNNWVWALVKGSIYLLFNTMQKRHENI